MDNEDLTIIKVEIPNALKFPAYYKVYISEMDSAILHFDLIRAKADSHS